MSASALAPGKAGWTECRFQLTATVDDPDARLSVRAEGDGALLIDVISLFRDDSVETGCRTDLLEAIKGLQPTIIRWPGGASAL